MVGRRLKSKCNSYYYENWTRHEVNDFLSCRYVPTNMLSYKQESFRLSRWQCTQRYKVELNGNRHIYVIPLLAHWTGLFYSCGAAYYYHKYKLLMLERFDVIQLCVVRLGENKSLPRDVFRQYLFFSLTPLLPNYPIPIRKLQNRNEDDLNRTP